ncbi:MULTISPECIES: IscS subfamily cysteine desulfurase [Candidatus Ichthyocystis]|uniref:Cysteine desulfurase IscS n=1 Tax=Candidatus Ichthyocystis hellenicum TaxID=1561003 RepID=A0A0S4M8A5_9BURK|nr:MULTISPECIES: IscS subfamily cysteine desulfurase [Ichthyocystis]CUT17620.1 Cysteine desulfurase [Candidatus Ichthyocystis hellenicum]
MKLPIYMDYSATTPIDPRVVEKMLPFLTEKFGNAASKSHSYGWVAESAVEEAREQFAKSIGADHREIIWTSGATESNNLAIKGAAEFYKRRGDHILTCQTEHKAVLDSVRALEKGGFKATYIKPEKNGVIDLELFKSSIRPDTSLVSIMMVNNEIGVIQDIAEIGKICRERNIIFHVDAVQALGRVPINLAELQVDLMSFSGHKIYGPKGIGVLYVRREPRVRLVPQMHGGGHERGLRSGTLPVSQIVGIGEAASIAVQESPNERERLQKFQKKMITAFLNMEGVFINGDLDKRIPHNVNASFGYVEGESLMMGIKNIAVSSGSACTSSSLEPSYVLRALGVGDDLAHSSIRITTGRFTTEEEVDYTISAIEKTVERLRSISPLWEMYKNGIDINSIDWDSSH